MSRSPPLSRREFVYGAAAGVAATYLGGCAAPGTRGPAPAPDGFSPADLNAPELSAAELAELALRRARRAGAEYADVRVIDTTRQNIAGRDGRIARMNDARDRGLGVRVLYKSGWGFAASPIRSGAEATRLADLAIEIAKASATLATERIRLADEPVHKDNVRTPFETDPLAVAQERKTGLLLAAMETMQSQPGIRRSRASFWTQRDQKLFASSEGSRIAFDLLASHASIGATAVAEGRFASRSCETPYLRAGFELIEQANLGAEAARVAAEALEQAKAPAVAPGVYDLVLDPQHLSLTIHESCGHPSELDRALGYEANYAGTSHLTPDMLNKHRYGSPHVNLVADNTEPGSLASTGYDDDGVAGQRWDIVRAGLFVGYSTSREVAPRIGLKRSTGSCRADGWASVPIVRIANIGLEPGAGSPEELIADVRRGLYIDGTGSFSIDQRRYNFQFGGDAFWLIENGRRTRMLRDVIYHGITPEFWGRCDAVAGAAHRRRYGFINCGKGQPGQSGWMTHAAAHARFRGVDVIAGESAT